MKRYIKSSYSDYSPEMWGKVRNQAPNGYLYIFKHGVGPGAIPDDVKVVKWKDLPNFYTAVWLDRWLDADELKAYDIPSETEINRYLDRIGYCQKDGDVVPCDEVTASTKIPEDADLPTFKEFATTEWDDLNDGSKRLKLKDLFVYYGTDKEWNASDPGYWYEIKIGGKTYKESKKYDIKNRERCYKAMQNAVKKLLDSNVEACDDIKASIDSDIARYKKSLERKAAKSGIYENFGQDEIRKLREKYRELPDDDTDYRTAERNRNSIASFEDWCTSYVGASTDNKYFANMVSCTSAPYYGYIIKGFYDNNKRGLAEDAWAENLTDANEIVNDFANTGYYIEVRNRYTNTIVEFPADTWFDEMDMELGDF